MQAAEENHPAIARLLMENRANLEETNHRGWIVLSLAAASSMGRLTSLDTLRYLLEQGASQVAVDRRGRTPRDQAVAENRDDAVAVFDEHRWV